MERLLNNSVSARHLTTTTTPISTRQYGHAVRHVFEPYGSHGYCSHSLSGRVASHIQHARARTSPQQRSPCWERLAMAWPRPWKTEALQFRVNLVLFICSCTPLLRGRACKMRSALTSNSTRRHRHPRPTVSPARSSTLANLLSTTSKSLAASTFPHPCRATFGEVTVTPALRVKFSQVFDMCLCDGDPETHV